MTLQPGTRGNPEAKILIVGEAYGSAEESKQQPFVGASGQELEKMLTEAGISPADCYFTNVVNARPQGNDMTKFFIPTKEAKDAKLPTFRGLYPLPIVISGMENLEALIGKLQPQLIIALGNYALWALTEANFRIGNSQDTARRSFKVPTGIASYRGSQLFSTHGIPLLPTLHPTYVLRSWEERNLVVHDLRSRAKRFIQGQTSWAEPPRNYIVAPTFDQCMEVIQNLALRAELSPVPILLSVDIETQNRFLECVGLAWSKHDAICIPIMCADKWDGYWTKEEEIEIIWQLGKLLEHPRVAPVGQNFFYDYQYFFLFGRMRPRWRHDTMLAHNVIFPGTPADLNHISSLYCDWHSYWKDEGKESAGGVNDLQRWFYNCRDVVVTYEAMTELWEVIKYYHLEEQYSIQMVRAQAILKPMLRGVLVDKKKRADEQLIQIETVSEMEARLEASMPESVWQTPKGATAWYRSAQQLAQIFYTELGLDEVRDRKTRRPTTNNDALDKIGKKYPILRGLTELLQQYRTMEAFQQFLEMKLGPDGRMRCSFSPTTETFRYRSSEDAFGSGRNLMNLPKGKEE